MVDHHSCDKLIGTIVTVNDLAEVGSIVVNDHRNDDELMENVEDWKPETEEEDASMEDAEANMDWEPPPLDDVAVSDSDSIDEFLDNESSDSDLYSVVKESSVIEMVDHHSCDKLIGTIVIMDDPAEVGSIVVNDHRNDDELMENVEDWKPETEEEDASMEDAEANMDWEPLPLRRSPRLAALRESSSLRPLRRSQRLAALYNGR
jgi:predicted DNA-binding ArsR family transcriptional regulator